MTLEELAHIEPELLASIRADAMREERERLLTLNAMMAPGLEVIISRAIQDGTDPATIALSCLSIVKEQKAETPLVNGLPPLEEAFRSSQEWQRRARARGKLVTTH